MKDKTVIITGGAEEIGYAAAQRFLKEEANTMLVDLDKETLQSKVEELDYSNVGSRLTGTEMSFLSL